MSDMMTHPPYMADRLENGTSSLHHLVSRWYMKWPMYAVDILQNIRSICSATGNRHFSHYIISYCISTNALITTLEIGVIVTISCNYIYHVISNHIMLILIAYMPRKSIITVTISAQIITIITDMNTPPPAPQLLSEWAHILNTVIPI